MEKNLPENRKYAIKHCPLGGRFSRSSRNLFLFVCLFYLDSEFRLTLQSGGKNRAKIFSETNLFWKYPTEVPHVSESSRLYSNTLQTPHYLTEEQSAETRQSGVECSVATERARVILSEEKRRSRVQTLLERAFPVFQSVARAGGDERILDCVRSSSAWSRAGCSGGQAAGCGSGAARAALSVKSRGVFRTAPWRVSCVFWKRQKLTTVGWIFLKFPGQ